MQGLSLGTEVTGNYGDEGVSVVLHVSVCFVLRLDFVIFINKTSVKSAYRCTVPVHAKPCKICLSCKTL